MVFTVEDGTGLSDANAYITISEFNSYWDDRGYVHSGITDANKKIAIIKATDYIENRFGTKFKGSKEFTIQSLSFPRINLYDNDGVLVEDIPKKLKNATAEYAKRAITNELMFDPKIDNSGLQLSASRKKVGPLETELKYIGGSVSIFKLYPSADRLLTEYINSDFASVVRA